MVVLAKSCTVELEASMQDKDLSLVWNCPQTEIVGKFDKMRIAQVMRNFLSNAIRFGPEGRKIYIIISYIEPKSSLLNESVNTSHYNLHQKEKRILFEIHDEGIGIPDGEYALVFERFVQSSKSDSNIKGTGLGLSICKEIIDKYKGEIWAEASDKGGAAFKFQIPC